VSGPYPVDVSGLDCRILSDLLQAVDPQAQVTAFTILGGQTFNDGSNKVSTAGRAEVELNLADGRTLRTVIKLCRPDAALQPLYRNEVAFYTLARSALDLEIPVVLGADFHEQSGTFALALEDLREREARFPAVTTPVTLNEVRGLLDVLAALHARFWQSPELTTSLAAIQPHNAGDLFRFFMSPDSVPALVRAEIATEQFKRELVEAIGTDEAALYDAVRRVQDHQATLPLTLCHGDCHIGNTYLLPGGRGGLLDWQLAARGYCMQDITYLIITALSVSVRRRSERELIDYYLAQLARHEISDMPTAEQAWYEYRLAANWCLYIGWLTTPKTHYGWEITACNVIRLATAVGELGSVPLAGELPPALAVT